jgi:RING-type zinc-finger/B-box zinc finger
MASQERGSDLQATVDDLIQCPICLDVFENPRSLPCLHTYCYRCLDTLPKDKTPRKVSVECPICRRVWDIPSEGVAGFAHNFFLQRMVDSGRPDTAEKGAGLCELCADRNKTAPATKYCIDCRLRQCEDCLKLHNRVSGGNHRIRENGAELERELELLASSCCIEHANKMLELYCFNCSCNVCVKCVSVNHPRHELQEIETVASNFMSQMSADVTAVRKRLDETVLQEQRQQSALTDFCDRMTIISDAVEKQCESIKSQFEAVIDNEKRRLLQELQLTKEKSLKHYAEIGEFTSLSLTSMKSFIRYSDELRSKGQPCDITRAGNDVRKRASTILEECPVEDIFIGPIVAFEAENLHNVFASIVGNSLVGRLVIDDSDTDGSK